MLFKVKDFLFFCKCFLIKVLLNFKLNGYLKDDYSFFIVKEMKFLFLLMLSFGLRFEGWMEFCFVRVNI